MALVEAQEYQTRYDDQQRPIRAYLGDLPLSVNPRLVLAFLDAQMPVFTQVATDPKMRILRTAFKGAARLLMDFWVIPHAKRGEMPMPDTVAMREDVLVYSIGYFYAMILAGMQECDWEILYVEQPDGTLDVTGVAPAIQPAVVLAQLAPEDAPDAPPDGAGESAESGDVRSLVYSGDDGQRQDDDSREIDE